MNRWLPLFLLACAQRPGSDGFVEESLAEIATPMLIGTGAANGAPGEPENRLEVFDLVPADGQRWITYLDDPGANHGLFAGDLDPCKRDFSQQHCRAMRALLGARIASFLGMHLKGAKDTLTNAPRTRHK